jgi:uncharacterized protein
LDKPGVNKPDPFRPLLGAGLFAFGYYILLNLVATVAQFIGRDMVAQTVPPLIAASLLGALAMAIFESRKLVDLGLHWREGSGRNLLTGMLTGIGGALLLILPSILFGMAHFAPAPGAEVSWRSILFTLVLLGCGAAGEEIAFRGFPLQFLMRGYGPWISIAGIGALFGLLHGFNPGATPLSIANTAGFGILFGFALLRTHDLWLPIGMHFGWNATLPFLGVELSGFTIKVTEYRLVWTSGNIWSGGNYGPEASLLASLVLVILFAVVWKLPVRKGWAYLLDYSPQAD